MTNGFQLKMRSSSTYAKPVKSVVCTLSLLPEICTTKTC